MKRDLRWMLVGAALDPGPAGALARRLLRSTGTPSPTSGKSWGDRVSNRILSRVQKRSLSEKATRTGGPKQRGLRGAGWLS